MYGTTEIHILQYDKEGSNFSIVGVVKEGVLNEYLVFVYL